VASPIPLLAPVMTTTLPLIPVIKFSFPVLCDVDPLQGPRRRRSPATSWLVPVVQSIIDSS
jgi:hypothetical protein